MQCRGEEPAIEELRPAMVIDLRKTGCPFIGLKMIFSQGGAEACLHIASVDGRLASIYGTSHLVRQSSALGDQDTASKLPANAGMLPRACVKHQATGSYSVVSRDNFAPKITTLQ